MPPMRRKGVARRSLLNAKRSRSKYSKKKKSKNYNSSSNSIVKMLTDNQLHVYQYPFSTRTKYPKIPDGKVDHSVGLNFAFSQNVKFQPTSPVYIILYGGHTTCACIFNFITPPGANAPRPNIISYGKFVQYMIPRYEIPTQGTTYKLVFDQCGYSSYRYVSAGLRITADDGPWNVGGQWQAMRIPCNKLNRDFRYVYNQSHPDWNTVLPTGTFMTNVNNTRFEDNPTFQSGMLKTIDDFEFRLKSQNLEHMFQGLPDYLDLDNVNFNQNTTEFGNEVIDGEDLQHNFDFTLDDNFDIVVVKIDSSGHLDNISYQVTANIECVTNLVGQFGHFSTETINATDRFHRLKHKMMNDNRLPGSYNYNKRYNKAM